MCLKLRGNCLRNDSIKKEKTLKPENNLLWPPNGHNYFHSLYQPDLGEFTHVCMSVWLAVCATMSERHDVSVPRRWPTVPQFVGV